MHRPPLGATEIGDPFEQGAHRLHRGEAGGPACHRAQHSVFGAGIAIVRVKRIAHEAAVAGLVGAVPGKGAHLALKTADRSGEQGHARAHAGVRHGKPSGEGKLLAPAPRLKVDPAYSAAAMEERIEGEVILSGVIRSDGAVVHIELIKALDERLDRAALAAFSKWRFDPALKNGVPVDVEVVVRVPFSLTPLDPERFPR